MLYQEDKGCLVSTIPRTNAIHAGSSLAGHSCVCPCSSGNTRSVRGAGTEGAGEYITQAERVWGAFDADDVI